jgi:hypothetical protein
MDKVEFEQDYAERSDVTVEWHHEKGLEGATCDLQKGDGR